LAKNTGATIVFESYRVSFGAFWCHWLRGSPRWGLRGGLCPWEWRTSGGFAARRG